MTNTQKNGDFKTEWVAFRPDIKVLDCTIRDGGLVNDHKFDDAFVKRCYDTAIASGVDYIELGYKGSPNTFKREDFGPWKFSEEEDLRRIVGDNPTEIKISVMADAERTDYETAILPSDQSVIDCIRVACYIHQMPIAMDMVADAKEKGYEVMMQLMSVSTVKEGELEAALKMIAECPADGVYVVDSFGALYSEQVRDLIKMYLKAMDGTGKEVGFHGHNNLQMAFSNTVEALIAGATRLDATLNGLGRGAGNCHMELILGFLHNPKFHVRPVLECVRDLFIPLKNEIDWGYSIPYSITGRMNQHPREAIQWRAGDAPDDYVAFYDKIVNESS
jgi:4-hydroxy 2-oxovalerate aldolase